MLQVYEGVSKMGFIHPAVLADNDVILTTYSTLRADFYHLGTKQGRNEFLKTLLKFQCMYNKICLFFQLQSLKSPQNYSEVLKKSLNLPKMDFLRRKAKLDSVSKLSNYAR